MISRTWNGAHNSRGDRDRYCAVSSLLSPGTTGSCRKNGPHIFEATLSLWLSSSLSFSLSLLLARSLTRHPPSSTPFYIAHRSSPSESFRSFPATRAQRALSLLPPVASPPFCPLAFSRRQILKSIEFPVGQTAKLPPNNSVVSFSTSCSVDAKYSRVAVPCFIHEKNPNMYGAIISAFQPIRDSCRATSGGNPFLAQFATDQHDSQNPKESSR